MQVVNAQVAKEALAPATKRPVNALQGIDLSSAGVVIVDYLPERAAGSHANENGQSEEEDLEEGDDDGFQQVGQPGGRIGGWGKKRPKVSVRVASFRTKKLETYGLQLRIQILEICEN